jgi:hypothetical protein
MTSRTVSSLRPRLGLTGRNQGDHQKAEGPRRSRDAKASVRMAGHRACAWTDLGGLFRGR